MFRSRGPGILEWNDDPFTSAVDSLIFPVRQSAGFDLSAPAADAHRAAFLGLQGAVLGSLQPGHVTMTASVAEISNVTVLALGASALTFTLHNIGGVTPGSQAEAGFLRATALWQSFLGDTVNIRLDVGFSSLGPGILGSTGSTSKVVSYAAVRAALTADQSSSDDATAVASLSAGSSLAFFTNNSAGTRVFDNDGSANNTYLDVTTADLKALGITIDANGQPVDTGAADGSIRFSSDFNWDFDPSDGINPGAIDFVGVAFHEIGHALGFVSGVDTVDYYSGGPGGRINLNPYAIFSTLDLFRYSAAGVRDLSYGGTKYFSLNGGATNLALFSTGDFQGDGNQASHWKDGLGIGIMDPTSVPAGQANVITARDIQALDVIGWNLVGSQGPGSISINDVQISEGNSGIKFATFTVTRSGGTAAFAVNFFTSDDVATTGDSDYLANTGTLNFGGGVNAQTISVAIIGDTKFETDQTFFVNLSGATNGASISDSVAIGTIINDDPVPAGSISIDDVTIAEGDGGTRVATFTVTRSGGTAAFSVAFVTSDGSATTADSDYVTSSATLNFGVGVNTQTISVTINGDTKIEADETFFVNLMFQSNGAIVSDGLGVGTIANDDALERVKDFNADAKSDLLFVNNTSHGLAEWQIDGLQVISAAQIGTINAAAGWDYSDRADFNGDGKTDLFFLNDTTHGTAIWQMNGTQVLSAAQVGTIDAAAGWHYTTHADFNGDGKSDLLFLNDTSHGVAVWQMNGTQVTAAAPVGTIDAAAGWAYRDVGDFNGDGKADLLLLNDTTHGVAVWQMNGTQAASQAAVGTITDGWHFADTGDFNGDGKTDLLFLNDTTHGVAVWHMNGAQVASAAQVGTITDGWHFVDAKDFSGDGKTDLLFLNDTTHGVAVWQMNGAQVTAAAQVWTINAADGWAHSGFGDFNGDGKTDLLFENATNHGVAVWEMNGAQVLAGAQIGTINAAADWHLIT